MVWCGEGASGGKGRAEGRAGQGSVVRRGCWRGHWHGCGVWHGCGEGHEVGRPGGEAEGKGEATGEGKASYVAFAAAGARVEGSELCGVSAALQLSGAILGSVECAHHRRHCCLCAPDNVVVGLFFFFPFCCPL